MLFPNRENALERRLREVEEEERRIRQHIKEVSRRLRKIERGRVDDLLPTPFVTGPVQISARGSAPTADRPEPQSNSPTREESQATVPPMGRTTNPVGDARFLRYFASGTFVHSRPLERERRVLRNKALFLLLVALLLAYLVYSLVF
ncbi:MAG: hypothetical protein NZ740_05785 [Kiritimatiellae bacterium]|nr:hypothetical protein [Kiritimatiellia bacterium]MDW8458603.1 hypothetical protein [Verrucomicrobiota bacterium]